MTSSAAQRTSGAVLILLLTLAAYLPALKGGFVWDDDRYVSQNPTLGDLDGLRRIWFDLGANVQYYPVVFTTFWVEHQLWGQDPLGYHLLNVLFHVGGALLFWLVLVSLKVPGAWLAAAIFALHPVHVESVAWITERKNNLSMIFYLASALCYLRFAGLSGRADTDARRRLMYVLGLVLFAGALLSKTVTCSLPAALLLVLWWKRDHLRSRDVVPLIPFFIVGVALGLTTAWVEKYHVRAEGIDWSLSAVERILVAGRVVWFYLYKLVWPAKQMFVYPRWTIDAGVWWQYLFPAAALGTVVGLWQARRPIGKGPLVAILLFGGGLFPAMGFFDVYFMRYSFVADHFQYHASLGPIALIAAVLMRVLRPGGSDAGSERDPAARSTLIIPAPHVVIPAILLVILGTLTWRQCHAYADFESLWRDTATKNPAAWPAHAHLGIIESSRGNLAGAIRHFREVVRLKPLNAQGHRNLALALAQQGQTDTAIEHFVKAVELEPDNLDARSNLGLCLMRQHRFDEAIAQFEECLRLSPDNATAHNNLGSVLLDQGQVDEAIEHFTAALRSMPGSALVHSNLAGALRTKGELAQATEHYQAAVRAEPNHAIIRFRLGEVLEQQGRTGEAIEQFRQTLRLDPNHAGARQALARLAAG